MATKQGVWNKALGRIRAQASVSTTISGSSPRQDVACDREYETVTETLLAGFPWRFASQRITLAEFGGDPDDGDEPEPVGIWTGRYKIFDSDQSEYARILKVIEVRHADTGERVEWEWTSDQDTGGTVQQWLYASTDGSIVVLAVVDRAEAEWPEYFTDTVAWHLAAAIAMDLTGNADVANRAEVKAAQTLIDAKITDGGLMSAQPRLRVHPAYSARLARHSTTGQVEGEGP
jgi:hypothetical protein